MESLNLTPTQALGIALSGVLGDTEMSECQEMAINIIKNLYNLGYSVAHNSILNISEQVEHLKKDQYAQEASTC